MSAAMSAAPAEFPLSRREMKRRRKEAWRAMRGSAPWGWGHPLRGWRLPVMILGFIAWWPIGLALLALFLVWRSPMSCNARAWMAPWKERMEAAMPHGMTRSGSGNVAFDEYRAAVLARLEEERRQLDAQQAEFAEFVKQLRRAKDQEEFERFMADRERKG